LPPDKRHPQVLKHSLGKHLVAANVNLALVKQALGHRSINSTMKYIGTTDTQAAAALTPARRLNFKTGARRLRGVVSVFDSHTLPPDFAHRRVVRRYLVPVPRKNV
jgi:hypothetical protein